MDSKGHKPLLGSGTICSISSTLVCAALACIAIIVIIATLSQLGIISFTKRMYDDARTKVSGAYNKSAGWYNDGMSRVARAPQHLRRNVSAQQITQQPPIIPSQHPAQLPRRAQQVDNLYPDEQLRNETFNQFNSYGCMENFDNEEYADTLAPPMNQQPSDPNQRIHDELGVIRKDLDEVKRNCPGTKKETFYSQQQENFDGGDGVYFDDNEAENFGNLTMSETKAFGDGIVCQQGVSDEQNILNPVGSLQIEGGSRCKNSDGVYDEIIGDMHPYYLNEIAARGEGNELIAATVRNTGNYYNGRSMMDEGKFYSQGQYFA